MPLSGKALSLIRHFPDFYAKSSGEHFQQLITVLSDALDSGEADLMQVLRSHFVDTAGNTGSQGFLNTQRGDLDQLFALYLEKLGGTSQLIQVNAQFQPDDILQLESLVSAIAHSHSPETPDNGYNLLCCDLQTRFKTVAANQFAQVQRYEINHVSLQVNQWQKPGELLIKLLVLDDALASYLRQNLSTTTADQLQAYQGESPPPPDLLANVTADINQQLPRRQLTQAFQQRRQQIRLAQILKQAATLGTADTPNETAPRLAQVLRRKLPLPLQKPLFTSSSSPITPAFTQQLKPELKALFQNPEIITNLLTIAQGTDPLPPVPENLELAPIAIQTLVQAALITLTRMVAGASGTVPPQPTPPPFAEDLMQQQPRGHTLMRLNRLLLEASYPYHISASRIPSQAQARIAVTALLNQAVLSDPDFYHRHKSFFDRLNLDAEARQLSQHHWHPPLVLPHLRQRLNRLLLEAAFPTALQKSYVPYRERLRELIQVLQRGASTRQGIHDIVAANLGIFGNSPAAIAARKTIEIEEYQPQLYRPDLVTVKPYVPAAPPPEENTPDLPQQITLENPNVEATVVTLRLRIDDNRENPTTELAPLNNLSWVNAETGIPYFTYYGALSVGDDLWILADGRLLLNGVAISPPAPSGAATEISTLHALVIPVGASPWRIESLIGELPSLLGQAQFDFARFDQLQDRARPLSPEQAQNYCIQVTYELTQLTPGCFLVKVPWHIPGFTDRFDASEVDHPRSQVPAIINRVRAAGVNFAIAYVQTFRDYHLITDWLTVIPAQRSSHPLFDQVTQQLPQGDFDTHPHFVEHHTMDEKNFDATSQLQPYGSNDSGGIRHTMDDRLILSGTFDYTRFDWNNTFA